MEGPPTTRRTRSLRERRLVHGFLLAAALAASVGLTGGGAAASADARPNLVVIMTDDQTVESMRVMSRVRSEIAAEGTTFAQNYVNFPLCCPSRATLMTGQYAHNHEVLDNEPPDGGFDVFERLHGTDNLATWLDEGGYRTALVGKYFNGYGDEDPTYVPPGWDEWFGAVAPAQHVYDYPLNENGRIVRYGSAPADFKGDVLTSKAVEFIERSAPEDDPFFLDLAYTTPHRAGPNPSPQPPENCSSSAKPPPRYAHSFDGERLPRRPASTRPTSATSPSGFAVTRRSGGAESPG